VTNEPGITRDRIYGRAEWRGRAIEIVDTGGIIPDDKALIPTEFFGRRTWRLKGGAAVAGGGFAGGDYAAGSGIGAAACGTQGKTVCDCGEPKWTCLRRNRWRENFIRLRAGVSDCGGTRRGELTICWMRRWRR